MEIKVLKFGGSSVANDQCIELVGSIISLYSKETKLIVVLSAQKEVTDNLILKAKRMQKVPDSRELDMLISTGEQVSIALLAMYLKSLSIKAISLTAPQIKILTDKNHTNAKIQKISHHVIRKYIERNDVLIIAGFQGVTYSNDITTLGRGGSDLTAVAIASCLNLEEVNIYSDVKGVYTTDPNQYKNAKLLTIASYQEMLEMASSGAKIINNRAVELAAKNGVKINLYSTFSKEKGTEIKEVKKMEERKISGIIKKDSLAILSIRLNELSESSLAKALELISMQDINIDLFTFDNDLFKVVADKEKAEKIESIFFGNELFTITEVCNNISKVSVIGLGMVRQSGVATEVVKTLEKNMIDIKLISCSEINISTLVVSDKADLALEKLHLNLIEKGSKQ